MAWSGRHRLRCPLASDLEPEEKATAAADEGGGASTTSSESEKEDEDEDTLPEDEGDLTGYTSYCDGPRSEVTWRAWKGRKIYQCLYCWDTLLCEPCYEKRMGFNAGVTIPPGENFCGNNHKYLCPVDGWKGVKNGMVLIEAEEPLLSRTGWLN